MGFLVANFSGDKKAEESSESYIERSQIEFRNFIPDEMCNKELTAFFVDTTKLNSEKLDKVLKDESLSPEDKKKKIEEVQRKPLNVGHISSLCFKIEESGRIHLRGNTGMSFIPVNRGTCEPEGKIFYNWAMPKSGPDPQRHSYVRGIVILENEKFGIDVKQVRKNIKNVKKLLENHKEEEMSAEQKKELNFPENYSLAVYDKLNFACGQAVGCAFTGKSTGASKSSQTSLTIIVASISGKSDNPYKSELQEAIANTGLNLNAAKSFKDFMPKEDFATEIKKEDSNTPSSFKP